VRRPLPQKTEVEVDEKKPEMIDVRRSPIKSIGQAQSINQHYTGKRPFDHKVDENVSPIEDSEDDETMLADNTPVIDGKFNNTLPIPIIFRLFWRNARNLASR
jgi:hypothetical protein